MHYARWQRHGNPNFTSVNKPSENVTDADRFALSYRLEGGCWLWAGPLNRGGYGKFSIKKRTINAHRWSYEHHIGPIPEGLEIDHLCRNRACVNPGHLEPVTRLENSRRGLRGVLRTQCPSGHELTPENTYLKAAPDGTRRICRECARTASREHKRRKRAECKMAP